MLSIICTVDTTEILSIGHPLKRFVRVIPPPEKLLNVWSKIKTLGKDVVI
jgi:hypothetical protein